MSSQKPHVRQEDCDLFRSLLRCLGKLRRLVIKISRSLYYTVLCKMMYAIGRLAYIRISAASATLPSPLKQ